MSSLFGTSSTPSSPEMIAQKQSIMSQVKNEMALANAQELMNKTNEKCYMKCVTKPSSSLSSSEETCLARCFDRYMEAFNIVSRSYTSRVSKERFSSAEQLN